MALSGNVKKLLRESITNPAASAALAAAVDANTLKTSYSDSAAVALNTAKTSFPWTAAAVVGVTTTNATTTWLRTTISSVVSNLQTGGIMASE